MDAYDRCTDLAKKILPILYSSVVEAENFSDHPRRTFTQSRGRVLNYKSETLADVADFRLKEAYNVGLYISKE